jgi:hypothetical protein
MVLLLKVTIFWDNPRKTGMIHGDILSYYLDAAALTADYELIPSLYEFLIEGLSIEFPWS